MAEANWTRPDAYLEDAAAGLDGALADHASRRMRRALARVTALLDRADGPACPASGIRIAMARDAAAAAVRQEEAMAAVLAAAGPVRIADALRDMCASRPIAAGVTGRPAVVELVLRGDAELSWAQPDTAWVVVAAAIEMLEEVATGPRLRLALDLREGRLALTATGLAPLSRREPPAVPTGSPLDLLADLLCATVERRRLRRRSVVRLVVATRTARLRGDGA